MKKNFVLIFILLLSLFCSGQERFFGLYPGWKINYAQENINGYTFYGSDTINFGYSNTPIFIETDDEGNLINTVRYLNDTVDGITVYTRSSYAFHDEKVLIGGIYKMYYKDYVLNPIIMIFDSIDFSIDTIIDLENYFEDRTTRILSIKKEEGVLLLIGDSQYSEDANIRSFFGVLDLSSFDFFYKDYSRPNYCRMAPYQIMPTPDGGYILSCEQDMQYDMPRKIYGCLLKIDSEGNEQWRHVIRGRTGISPYPDFEAATYRPRVFNAPDGNYWVVWTDPDIITNLYMQSNPESSIRIAKLTDLGDTCTLTGERSLMGEFDDPALNWWIINDSYQAENGDMYLLIKNYWGINTSLAKIHFNGVGAWFRTYKCYPDDDAESSYTELAGLTRTDDGGFMLTGKFRSTSSTMFPDGIQASVVFKVDSCGCFEEAGCNDHCMDSYSEHYVYMQEASIYPNPAKDKITVNFDYEGSKDTEFEYSIYNIDGKQILNDKSKACDLAIGTCNLKIDICDLPSGYYMIQFWGGGKIYTGKFVKE